MDIHDMCKIQWLSTLTQDIHSAAIYSDLHHRETEQKKVINASLYGLDLNSDASVPCGIIEMDHDTGSFSPVGALPSHHNKRFSCWEMDYRCCEEYNIESMNNRKKTVFQPFLCTIHFLLLPIKDNCNQMVNKTAPILLNRFNCTLQ